MTNMAAMLMDVHIKEAHKYFFAKAAFIMYGRGGQVKFVDTKKYINTPPCNKEKN
jgi:hypothetical protein